MKCFLFASLTLVLLYPPLLASDWPQFRGAAGSGIAEDANPPLTWGTGHNIKWRTELPGPGNSSPIISNGKVFVSCAKTKGTERGLYCFDRKDGKELWSRVVQFNKIMPTHESNPYGASSPAADGERVVVWHGSAGLFCYDFAGDLLWSRQLGEFRHMWGYASSPVVHGDRVILNCGPGKRVFVTALNLETGKTLWEQPEPVYGDGQRNEEGHYAGSWSTPVILTAGERTLAVCSMPTRVNGYDLSSGEVIWSCEGLKGPKGELAYSSPLIAGEVCVAISGFNGPSIGFKLGGVGDITGNRRLWRSPSNPQNIGSGVVVGGYAYVPDAGPAGIRCIDVTTGQVMWTERRPKAYWGSIVAAGGRLYLTDQGGTTLVFKPSPEKFVELAVNTLEEKSNSTPAISDGEIFLRATTALYCVGD